MSSVRMCDRCGRIFPEAEEGSAVGTITVNQRNPRTMRLEQVQQAQDVCALCGSGNVAVQPRLEILGTETLPQ